MITVADIRTYKPTPTAEAVYIGRRNGARPASPLANPYKLVSEEYRAACLKKYREWLAEQGPTSPARRELLRLAEIAWHGDLVLLCWCPRPLPCHGDVIKGEIERELKISEFWQAWSAADEAGRVWLEERAAIVEYEGGLSRTEAEAAAAGQFHPSDAP